MAVDICVFPPFLVSYMYCTLKKNIPKGNFGKIKRRNKLFENLCSALQELAIFVFSAQAFILFSEVEKFH